MGTIETGDSRSKHVCVLMRANNCLLKHMFLLHVTMLFQLIREHVKAAIQYKRTPVKSHQIWPKKKFTIEIE